LSQKGENTLDVAEQDLFDMLMSVMLFLNSNGIPLEHTKKCIMMKVNEAFARYPELKESYDIDNKGQKWDWRDEK
tara:strand:+ start:853 stop:1077 length:225 start_codon:yes stop_codon:yes gene_type:complete